MRRVILDVDTGIDDAMAILLALRSRQLAIEAITTVAGNTIIEQVTENTLKVLELAGADDIPVAKGASRPLVRPLHLGRHVHGEDGLGNTNLPQPKLRPLSEHAVDLLISRVMASPGEITLITSGTMTNLALALLKEPRLAKEVKEVFLMGGAVARPGNVTPVAEANIWRDPEAAKIVFHSGMPLTMVGLDVTMKAILTPDHLEPIRSVPSPVNDFVLALLQHYMGSYRRSSGLSGCPLHDPMTVAVAIDRTLVTTADLAVEVETSGEFTSGQTVADRRKRREFPPPNVKVCLDVDAERFLRFFVNTLATESANLTLPG
ncbi:MAG: nucleoside hydrolase [Chloroflexi bacterium]|nr:nucleoside hydrolase [Chloroflexota bacterium]